MCMYIGTYVCLYTWIISNVLFSRYSNFLVGVLRGKLLKCNTNVKKYK